jgi:glutamate synthase (NADPH/NADH) small chain
MPREHHPDGYLRHVRRAIGKRDPEIRKGDFDEIWAPRWDAGALREQGERCLDCGVPTCMSGCPIGNRIPEWNDLVHRSDWKAALEQLHATNNFPEFTGYTCPAPCEDACVLAVNDDAVAIKSIERAIVDRGWEEGWIQPEPPAERTGLAVAVVGSGPAGLAAAQQLNRAGHRVTVYERDDAPGGLMTYGIPDFKFARSRVERRVDQLCAEGIAFRTGTEVGVDVDPARLQAEHDAVCLALGAQRPRALSVEGRSLGGVVPAMAFLTAQNRRQNRPRNQAQDRGQDQAQDRGQDRGQERGQERVRAAGGPTAAGKNVVVLGGGDTGADCVATAHRQGAAQVVQIGINQRGPAERPDDNPWPEAAKTYTKTYAQQEGGREVFGVDTRRLVDTDGDGAVDELRAERVEWTYVDGRRAGKTVLDPDLRIPADLVLVAIGFTGPDAAPLAEAGVGRAEDGTLDTDERLMTGAEGVFAAGDARIGASLVVWAIGEGRDAARQIDRYLTGGSDLPASLQTRNPPLGRRRGRPGPA